MRKVLPFFLAFVLAGCTISSEGISSDSTRPAKGNQSASIVVEEYGDFQCPACAAAASQIVTPLLEQYGDRIRFEFKNFPLRQIHPTALEAAEAAECAADQQKYWQFYDIAYEKQADLSSSELRTWGKDLDLDEELFDRCIKSHAKRKPILAEYQEGIDRGVSGTPTFFVNGVKVPSTLKDITAAIEGASGRSDLPL